MALKLLEGTIRTTLEALREEITASTRGKLGGLLIRPARRGLRTRLDPDTYGGAYLLGLARARRHRPRQLVGDGDRERDPLRGARRAPAGVVDAGWPSALSPAGARGRRALKRPRDAW